MVIRTIGSEKTPMTDICRSVSTSEIRPMKIAPTARLKSSDSSPTASKKPTTGRPTDALTLSCRSTALVRIVLAEQLSPQETLARCHRNPAHSLCFQAACKACEYNRAHDICQRTQAYF